MLWRVLLALLVEGGAPPRRGSPPLEAGATVETDVLIWNRLSARASFRYQHFRTTPDECSYFGQGERFDLAGGVRVDVLDPSRFHRARPFFASELGVTLRTMEPLGCRHPDPAPAFYLDGATGIDLFVVPQVALRFSFRVSLEDPGGVRPAAYLPDDEVQLTGAIGLVGRF